MAGTPIDRGNLPPGVTINPNNGRYVITNDKGQTSTVGANNLEELNNYKNSWQSGTPATVNITRPDGSTKQEVYNPAAIQNQKEEVTSSEVNRQNLKKAGLFDNGDGTFSERKQNDNFGKPISADEAKQRLASVGATPSTDISTSAARPTTSEVKASTDAVNNVTNNPSSLNDAPAPTGSGTTNSPVSVESPAATTLRADSDPTLAQNTTPPVETPSTGSTNNVSDPAQRAQAAAAAEETITTPSDITLNPMGQDPAQRAQVADQVAIDNAQTISTVQDPQQAAQAKLNATPDVAAANPMSQDPSQRSKGISAPKENAQSGSTQQDASNFKQLGDWRVRLSLAPGATYLYKDPNVRTNQSILLPLAQTDGVIFPYTPAISVSYVADYAPTNLTHSNYTFNSYTNSKVENITIGCDFTAQDTAEATYLLAVIHFFRAATKMFYGQDKNPKNGTPPPLCYLNGLGAFQFDEHPLAITAFNYTLPTDVDYIRAGVPTTSPGTNKSPVTTKSNAPSTSGDRLNNNNLSPGGRPGAPVFSINYSTREPTYVPTKISLSITAVPIVTRNDISNTFSLEKYATGELLRGSKRAGGGIW